MLVEEMIFALVEEKSVGIVDPILLGCEMNRWTKFIGEDTWGWARIHGAYLILFI